MGDYVDRMYRSVLEIKDSIDIYNSTSSTRGWLDSTSWRLYQRLQMKIENKTWFTDFYFCFIPCQTHIEGFREPLSTIFGIFKHSYINITEIAVFQRTLCWVWYVYTSIIWNHIGGALFRRRNSRNHIVYKI